MNNFQSFKVKNIGVIRWFDPKLGYGFIDANISGDNRDVFVHWSKIQKTSNNYTRWIQKGDIVSFDITMRTLQSKNIQLQGHNVIPIAKYYKDTSTYLLNNILANQISTPHQYHIKKLTNTDLINTRSDKILKTYHLTHL